MTSLIGGVKLQYNLRLLSLGYQVVQSEESESNNRNQVICNYATSMSNNAQNF